MAPDFSSPVYWSERLRGETEGFEWLSGSESAFTSAIHSAVDSCQTPARILHIGPGSSTVSLHLRGLVADPRQVVNVDFAESAVELGSQWEAERWPEGGVSMCWKTADLLRFADVREKLAGTEHFDVVVDKSTADAVACGDDVPLHGELVHRVRCHLAGDPSLDSLQNALHPTFVLALHLACITKPGAVWICLSYSSERFVAFENAGDGDKDQQHVASVEELVFSLWKVDSRESFEIDIPEPSSDTTVHRPKVYNWLYILQRSKVMI